MTDLAELTTLQTTITCLYTFINIVINLKTCYHNGQNKKILTMTHC